MEETDSVALLPNRSNKRDGSANRKEFNIDLFKILYRKSRESETALSETNDGLFAVTTETPSLQNLGEESGVDIGGILGVDIKDANNIDE